MGYAKHVQGYQSGACVVKMYHPLGKQQTDLTLGFIKHFETHPTDDLELLAGLDFNFIRMNHLIFKTGVGLTMVNYEISNPKELAPKTHLELGANNFAGYVQLQSQYIKFFPIIPYINYRMKSFGWNYNILEMGIAYHFSD